jgi:hypothetical protein
MSDEGESEDERDHLLVWKSDEPLDEGAAKAILGPLEEADVLIGSAAGVAEDWAGDRVGCVVVKGEPGELLEGAALSDWDLVPFPGGVAVRDGALAWVEKPMALPAAPLVVKKGRDWKLTGSVVVDLDLEGAGDAELALLDELTELFLEAYRGEAAGAIEGAALAEREDGGRTLTLQGWNPPDIETARGHLHWWLEELARFLPVTAVRIRSGRAAGERRGLPPSWIGPLLVIGAAFGARLLADPSIALRASTLAWLFGPVIITFLSRAHVGRITWAVTVVNALAQAAIAFIIERPDLIAPSPTGESTEDLLLWSETVRSTLEWFLYGSAAVGLVWVLTYLANRRRPL